MSEYNKELLKKVYIKNRIRKDLNIRKLSLKGEDE